MPFGNDDLVEITYQANVQGLEELSALKQTNSEIINQTAAQTSKTNEATEAHKKSANALLQAHHELRTLHRELFVGVAIFGLVTTALTEMAKGSESAQIGLDTLNTAATKFFGNIANNVAMVTAFWGAVSGGASFGEAAQISKDQIEAAKSLDTKVKLLQMESNLYKTQGDELMALRTKQLAEKAALEKHEGEKSYQQFKDLLDRQHVAEIENFRLSELGLKNHLQIARDFQRNLVGGAQGSTSNVIENFLNGEKQSPKDIMQTFQKGFSHAIAEALSQSLFTTFAQGGNFFTNFKNLLTGRTPQVIAAERAAKASEDAAALSSQMLAVLNQIAECTCSSAKMLSGGATYTPPKQGTASKLANAFGVIGNATSSILGIPGIGGGGGVGGGGGGGPELTIPNAPLRHSGGWINKFASGGEVPIMGMPGEFVVRRPAAQANKDALEDLNSGGNLKHKGGNVFLIKANDAQSFVDMLASPGSRNAIETQVIRSIMQNSNMRNIIKEFAR